jgi:hypothetical protein
LELEDSSCDRVVDSNGIVFDPILVAPMFSVYHVLGTTVGHKASFSTWEPRSHLAIHSEDLSM